MKAIIYYPKNTPMPRPGIYKACIDDTSSSKYIKLTTIVGVEVVTEHCQKEEVK